MSITNNKAWKSYRLGAIITTPTGDTWKIVDVQTRTSVKGYDTRVFTLESEGNGQRIRKTARGITMFSTGINVNMESIPEPVEALIDIKPPEPTVEPEAAEDKNAPIRHANHQALLRAVRARLNTWLVGPAGSGKTSAAEAVAADLGLKFYSKSVGPQTTESSLLGYQDANGNTVRTLLREAFEHGGVFLMDEIDAANPGVLVVVNSLLANEFCAFPDGMVKKHHDFILIAGANTIGLGADRQYVGRQQIDGATLDRFVMMVWEYDATIEARVAGASLASVAKAGRPKVIRFQSDMEDTKATQSRVDQYVAYVVAVRNAVNASGKGDSKAMRFIVSPRASKHGAALIREGFTMADTCDLALWKGLDAETRSKLEAAARAH